MSRSAIACALMVAMMSGSAFAATAKPKAGTAKTRTQPAYVAPPPPSFPAGPRVPEATKLRPTTAAETEANAIWNVRAALNIAALQCQFLPFLAAVRTYNDILRQHSEELDRTRLTMIAHFKRYDGAKAQNSFDQYTTRTYNSFSTLDAQLPFCEAAGWVGRQVLATPKGKLGELAMKLNPVMRASLSRGVGLPPIDTEVDVGPVAVPEL